jgi:hypothetical protein
MLLAAAATPLYSRRVRAVLVGRSGMESGIDERIWIEPTVPRHWEHLVADQLDGAISRVEIAHGRSFPGPTEVWLCSSQQSYNRRTGDPVGGSARGSVFLNRVVLSPRCLESKTTIGILTHELSHLHLRQVMGRRYTTTVPGWFQEGLAVFVAQGAGAEPVSIQAAKEAIRKGTELAPESTGHWIPRMASAHGLRHHMFYRQSAMFVEHLATTRPGKFRAFLDDIQSGKNFPVAFASRFGDSPQKLWYQFIESLLPQNRSG